jgi:hypothetical protein
MFYFMKKKIKGILRKKKIYEGWIDVKQHIN